MKSYIGIAAAMLAGAAFGAVAVGGSHAQSKPGAYVVVDITEVSDPDTFKTLLPKAPGAVAAFGGQFIARTENITRSTAPPPSDLSSSASRASTKPKPGTHLQPNRKSTQFA
jgi:hypothetical protein